MTQHAVIYDRGSSESQRDNYSRVNAHQMGIQIAEREGCTWEYVKEIGSGTTLAGRPEMMKILDRIEAGEIQVIIVQDLDRLARPEQAVVYSTIRNTIIAYGVIIFTHTSRVDLNNDSDDFMADIQMSVAKLERKKILKRAKRGREARAEAGKFMGGSAPTGYRIAGSKAKADYEIDPEGAKVVQAVFNFLEENWGNATQAAQALNEAGYRGERGSLFSAMAVKTIAVRKLYVGLFESKATPKVTPRPDLQIISLEQFKLVNSLLESRSPGPNRRKGVKGEHLFTGFVQCASCGGPMVGGDRGEGDVRYQCANYRLHGKAGCSTPKTYAQKLIMPPVVEFIAKLVREQIDFCTAIADATAQHSISELEDKYTSQLRADMEGAKAGMRNLVDGVAIGAFKPADIAGKMAELREREQFLTLELANVASKAEANYEWQQAAHAFYIGGVDMVADRLNRLATESPQAFRRFMSLVFMPHSLKVMTSKSRQGSLTGYQLTPAILELKAQVSGDNTGEEPFEFLCLVPNKPDKIEILG